MKEKRPRIKKSRKEPSRERKVTNPPQITLPWGRGASAWRPGLLIKKHFEENPESCCADAYYDLSQQLERLNEERIQIGEKALRRPTYSSFAKYFHWFLILGLIERTDKKEPAIYDFLEERVFYRLTSKGEAEVRSWEDPVRAAHPEFG
ncbi:hypothetical protein ES703_41553 [subsurface metagenome]